MSLLCANSYVNTVRYFPDCIKKIDSLIMPKISEQFIIKDVDLANHTNNVMIKIGFMILGRNFLDQSIHGKQIDSNFFLSNFIFDTKAFLDSISVILNYNYKLEFSGGNIDLKLGSFIDKLKKYEPILVQSISKQEKWIKEVVSWRENLIHRKSSPTVYYSPPDPTGKNPMSMIVKMPLEPISIFGNEYTELQKKHGKVEQDIIPFCDRWIQESKLLLETSLDAIAEDYSKPRN